MFKKQTRGTLKGGRHSAIATTILSRAHCADSNKSSTLFVSFYRWKGRETRIDILLTLEYVVSKYVTISPLRATTSKRNCSAYFPITEITECYCRLSLWINRQYDRELIIPGVFRDIVRPANMLIEDKSQHLWKYDMLNVNHLFYSTLIKSLLILLK